MANPSPSRALPMIEPVIWALTTSTCPRARTNSARISSGALPKDTLSNPPMACPACSPTASVAFRTRSARGMMPSSAVTNTHVGAACNP